jgi:hypothetical protein
MFPESGGRAQNTFVDEVDERKILEEIVLNRSSRKEDSSFGLEAHQGLVGLVLRVFQPVAFVTENESDLALVEDGRVKAKSFVRQNLGTNEANIKFNYQYYSLVRVKTSKRFNEHV